MNAIRLQDFRCYTEQDIAFKSGINLLVGDNASGKTSVLKACRYVLGAFFAGFSDENTKWVRLDVDDFRRVLNDGMLLPERPIRIHFDIEDTIEYPELLQEPSSPVFFQNYPYSLTKNSKRKNSRSLIGGIRGYRDYATALQQEYIQESGQGKALPLFTAFSIVDIYSKRKVDADKFKVYSPKPSFGYYKCLEGDVFFPYWMKRLLILQEGRKGHPEIAIVRQAIQDALGANGCNIIDDMQVRPNLGKVYYLLIDGREVEADYLSDGYRRLVDIVTDIAFRCALLNRGMYGEQTCAHTKGTVLIDEVDLHLHPTLQSLLLKGLKLAFPRLQFIVSSHAPMVMSGVQCNEENQVYKLDFSPQAGYSVTTVDTYGMDLSTLTNVVPLQTPRTAEVDQQLAQLFDLVDAERVNDAQSMLDQMKKMFGDTLPEFAEVQAMLHCLED